MTTFDFRLFSRITVGAGSTNKVLAHVEAKGYRRIGMIVDAGVEKLAPIVALKGKLEGLNILAHSYTNAIAEPTFDDVDVAVASFRGATIDALIVFGGGSTMDLAKGISVLLTNPGPAISYRGYGLIKADGIPLIALPTTAGSGSEVTPNASYVDAKEKRKLGINTEKYLPELTILDPELTLSCLPAVTISSGLDALVHTLEAFTAVSTTPLARMFAREAFRLIFPALPRVIKSPSDLEVRGDLLLGAYCAATALINAASGPAGVLSYPLGVHYKVPHGMAGAIFLVPVATFNVARGYTGYAELYDLTPNADRTLSTAEKNEAFVAEIAALCSALGVPTSLRAYGVTPGDIHRLAEESYRYRTKSAEQNPIPVKAAELEQIMQLAMGE